MTINVDISIDEMLKATDTEFKVSVSVDGSLDGILISNPTYYLFNQLNEQIYEGIGAILNNEITLQVPGSFFPSPADDCSVRVDMLVNGENVSRPFFFDVVKYLFFNPVSDTDVMGELRSLEGYTWDGEKGYSRLIELAYKDVKRDIKRLGNRSRLIVNSSQIKPLVVIKSLSKICREFTRNDGQIWLVNADFYENQYKSELKSTSFKYDLNDDGYPETAKRYGVKTVKATR